MTRRELFRRGGTIAAGATATVTVGSRTVPRFSPVGRAAAIAPAIPIGILAGAAGVKYLTGKSVGEYAIDLFTGDDRDYSGYTGGDALHQEIAVGAAEMASADERVMTSIQNNITHSDNVALAKGKAAIIEAMNAGKTESEAQTAMQDAIDDYFASIQRNVVSHWRAQYDQAAHFYAQVVAHEDFTNPSNLFDFWTRYYEDPDPSWRDTDNELAYLYDLSTPTASRVTVSLMNGDTVDDVPLGGVDEDAGTNYYELRNYAPSEQMLIDNIETYNTAGVTPGKLRVTDPETSGEYIEFLDVQRFQAAWTAISDKRDSVNADLSGFVSDVYASYSPGDIPTEDLVDPITASTELRQNYDNRAGQSAHAAMLGIPTEAELTASLEIVSSEAEDGIWEVEADIFTDHVPTVDVSGSASISSGVLTLSKDPVTDSVYELTTTAPETVEFNSAELSDNGDGTWQVDLSGDLSTTSTSVDTLLEEEGFTTGTTYQPSNWSEPFYIAYNYIDEATGEEKGDFTQIESETTIVEVTDSNGETVENFRTESRNNQTADVAELEAEIEQLRQLQIDLQEEAQEKVSGGGGGALSGANSYVYAGIIAVIGYILIDNK